MQYSQLVRLVLIIFALIGPVRGLPSPSAVENKVGSSQQNSEPSNGSSGDTFTVQSPRESSSQVPTGTIDTKTSSSISDSRGRASSAIGNSAGRSSSSQVFGSVNNQRSSDEVESLAASSTSTAPSPSQNSVDSTKASAAQSTSMPPSQYVTESSASSTSNAEPSRTTNAPSTAGAQSSDSASSRISSAPNELSTSQGSGDQSMTNTAPTRTLSSSQSTLIESEATQSDTSSKESASKGTGTVISTAGPSISTAPNADSAKDSTSKEVYTIASHAASPASSLTFSLVTTSSAHSTFSSISSPTSTTYQTASSDLETSSTIEQNSIQSTAANFFEQSFDGEESSSENAVSSESSVTSSTDSKSNLRTASAVDTKFGDSQTSSSAAPTPPPSPSRSTSSHTTAPTEVSDTPGSTTSTPAPTFTISSAVTGSSRIPDYDFIGVLDPSSSSVEQTSSLIKDNSLTSSLQSSDETSSSVSTNSERQAQDQSSTMLAFSKPRPGLDSSKGTSTTMDPNSLSKGNPTASSTSDDENSGSATFSSSSYYETPSTSDTPGFTESESSTTSLMDSSTTMSAPVDSQSAPAETTEQGTTGDSSTSPSQINEQLFSASITSSSDALYTIATDVSSSESSMTFKTEAFSQDLSSVMHLSSVDTSSDPGQSLFPSTQSVVSSSYPVAQEDNPNVESPSFTFTMTSPTSGTTPSPTYGTSTSYMTSDNAESTGSASGTMRSTPSDTSSDPGQSLFPSTQSVVSSSYPVAQEDNPNVESPSSTFTMTSPTSGTTPSPTYGTSTSYMTSDNAESTESASGTMRSTPSDTSSDPGQSLFPSAQSIASSSYPAAQEDDSNAESPSSTITMTSPTSGTTPSPTYGTSTSYMTSDNAESTESASGTTSPTSSDTSTDTNQILSSSTPSFSSPSYSAAREDTYSRESQTPTFLISLPTSGITSSSTYEPSTSYMTSGNTDSIGSASSSAVREITTSTSSVSTFEPSNAPASQGPSSSSPSYQSAGFLSSNGAESTSPIAGTSSSGDSGEAASSTAETSTYPASALDSSAQVMFSSTNEVGTLTGSTSSISDVSAAFGETSSRYEITTSGKVTNSNGVSQTDSETRQSIGSSNTATAVSLTDSSLESTTPPGPTSDNDFHSKTETDFVSSPPKTASSESLTEASYASPPSQKVTSSISLETTQSNSQAERITAIITSAASDQSQANTGSTSLNSDETAGLTTDFTSKSDDPSTLPSNTENVSRGSIRASLTSGQRASETSDSRSTAGGAGTTWWLPSSIQVQTKPTNSGTSSFNPAVTATLPQIIAPPTMVSAPKDSSKITVGFKTDLNYQFLVANSLTVAQIFHFLPSVLSFPFEENAINQGVFDRDARSVLSFHSDGTTTLSPDQRLLSRNRKNKRSASSFNASSVEVIQIMPMVISGRNYLISVAVLYFPSAYVSELQSEVYNSSSVLFDNPDSTLAALAALIDTSIPLTGLIDDSSLTGSSSGGRPSGQGPLPPNSQPRPSSSDNSGSLESASSYKMSSGIRKRFAIYLTCLVCGTMLWIFAFLFLYRHIYEVKPSNRTTTHQDAARADKQDFAFADITSFRSGNTDPRSDNMENVISEKKATSISRSKTSLPEDLLVTGEHTVYSVSQELQYFVAEDGSFYYAGALQSTSEENESTKADTADMEDINEYLYSAEQDSSLEIVEQTSCDIGSLQIDEEGNFVVSDPSLDKDEHEMTSSNSATVEIYNNNNLYKMTRTEDPYGTSSPRNLDQYSQEGTSQAGMGYGGYFEGPIENGCGSNSNEYENFPGTSVFGFYGSDGSQNIAQSLPDENCIEEYLYVAADNDSLLGIPLGVQIEEIDDDADDVHLDELDELDEEMYKRRSEIMTQQQKNGSDMFHMSRVAIAKTQANQKM